MQSNNYNRQVIDLKQDERSFTTQSKSTYGYCKIETRGRKCRIKLSINNLVKSNNIYKAHLIKVNEKTTKLIPIGVIELDKNNTGSLNISTDSDKVMGTNYSMNEFSIIAITCKENKDNIRFPLVGYIKEVDYEWKKNIVTSNSNIQKQQRTKKIHTDVHKEVKEQQPIHVDKEEIDKSGLIEQVKEKAQDININHHEREEQQSRYQEEYNNFSHSYNENQKVNEEYETKQSIEIDDVGNQTFDIIKKHFSKKELTKIHENIFKEYPKMNPFENQNDDKEWIRIEPSDIIYFPMETWMLTNNTFLLNAHRKYKHLILGRDKITFNEKPYFVLGVPGVYYQKDRVAAYFYGFKEFVTCSGAKTKSGEYGYWTVEIECSWAGK